eukprot:TRINITY_DN31533_c0_g1_i1.p1 TRINITY_DN31533_c0_g1~~TRINITY_DN31533_c0_g1_i1.p1  ORF type:complete len:845 (+),score=227.61 TRINITY_DN31533_c0_g1_i1:77-2536(+)
MPGRRKGPPPAVARAVAAKKDKAGEGQGADGSVPATPASSAQASVAASAVSSAAARFAFGAGVSLRVVAPSREGTLRVSVGTLRKLGARLGQRALASLRPFSSPGDGGGEESEAMALLSILVSSELDTMELAAPRSLAERNGVEVYLAAVPESLRLAPVRRAAVWPCDEGAAPLCTEGALDAVAERLWGRILPAPPAAGASPDSLDVTVACRVLGQERRFAVRALSPRAAPRVNRWYCPPRASAAQCGLALSMEAAPPRAARGGASRWAALPAAPPAGAVPAGYAAEFTAGWEWLRRGLAARGAAQPLCGVLVTGPSGVGKTHFATQLAEAVAAAAAGDGAAAAATEAAPPVIVLTAASALRDGVDDAVSSALASARRSPEGAVVVIDDADYIFGAGGGADPADDGAGARRRAAQRIADAFDATDRSAPVALVACASSADSVGAALWRPGRFGHEAALAVPATAAQRAEILTAALAAVAGWQTAGDAAAAAAVREAAEKAHGFVAADLSAVAAAAAAAAAGAGRRPGVADLRAAAAAARPSSLRGIEVEVPTVRWADIGGQDDAKRVLQECVDWPLRHRALFEQLRLRPPCGVLLYGPPGCSKTMLAKALATECSYNFIAVKGPELYNKWVGESEKAVRQVFAKARQAAPAVLFFDELDGMCGVRGEGGVTDRVISQFLTEMDGLPRHAAAAAGRHVVVLAATNRPDNIDAALLRPGRIDRKVYIGLPDADTREQIVCIALRRVPCAPDVSHAELARSLEGRSGAECVAAIKEGVLRRAVADPDAPHVDMADLLGGVAAVRPRTGQRDLDFYRDWGRRQ